MLQHGFSCTCKQWKSVIAHWLAEQQWKSAIAYNLKKWNSLQFEKVK